MPAIQGVVQEEPAAVVAEQRRNLRPALLLLLLHLLHLLYPEVPRGSVCLVLGLQESHRPRTSRFAADPALRGQEFRQAPLL